MTKPSLPPFPAPLLILMGVLAVLALGLGLTYGPMGYHPTDQGMIFGLSWRIYSGQVPYVDFFSLRLPGSLYLHSLWHFLPDSLQLRSARIFFYAQNLSFVALPLVFLAGRTRLSTTRLVAVASLAVGISFFAMNNFPNMPWHTLDGILFSILGTVACMYGLTSRSPSSLWLAGLSFGVAILCKQNFVAAAGVFWFVCLFGLGTTRAGGLRSLALATSGLGLPLLALALYLAQVGGLTALFAQVGAASDPTMIRTQGFDPFVTSRGGLAFGAGLSYGACTWWGRLASEPKVRDRLGALSIAIMVGLMLALVLGAETHTDAKERSLEAWMVVLGFTLMGFAVLRRRVLDFEPLEGQLLVQNLLLLAIAWSAAISWSVVSPMLALAPLVLHNPWLFSGTVPFQLQRIYPVVGLAVLVLGFGFFHELNHRYPYRERPYEELTVDLGQVFPKLSGIYSSSATASRYADLARIIEGLGPGSESGFTVLRDFPAIHYLADAIPPVGTDWYLEQEVQPVRERLLAQLEQVAPVAIVDRSPATQVRAFREGPPQGCRQTPWKRFGFITHHIAAHWTLEAQTPFFCVYRRPAATSSAGSGDAH